MKLDYKITITHDQRNKIQIKLGYANGATATSPLTSSIAGGGKSLGAFNYCGGSYPMEGNGGSSMIEIGLDATDFYNAMTGNQAIFFLIVTSKGGTGSIDSFSLMDYSNGSQVKEIPCSKKNVTIVTGTTTLSIPYAKSVVVTKCLSAQRSASGIIKTRGRSIFVPFDGKSSIVITNIQGRTLKSFETERPGWLSLHSVAPKGGCVVTIKNRTKVLITATFK